MHRAAQKFASMTDCPRCGSKRLDPQKLRCVACFAEFTPAGLEDFRARPAAQARRVSS